MDKNTLLSRDDVCSKRFTRDQLRYFLFLNEEAGTADSGDAEANAIAQHLENDNCQWCEKNLSLLSWTEPGLTLAGREKFDQLMEAFKLESAETAPVSEPASQPDAQQQRTDFKPTKLLPPVVSEADQITVQNALNTLQSVRANASNANSWQTALAILEFLELTLDLDDSPALEKAMSESFRKEFKNWFDQLSAPLMKNASSLLMVRRSRPEDLRLLTDGNEELALAAVLAVASLVARFKPFPITSEGSRVKLDFDLLQDSLRERVETGSPSALGSR